MTDTQLEEVIKNVRTVTFQEGIHSLFADEIPGYIGLVFNDEHLYDVIKMYKYIKHELAQFTKTVHIRQVKADRIDFNMVIEMNSAIVLTVKNIECKKGRFEIFCKKESQEKPINLLIIRNSKIDTLEKMAESAEAAGEAELHQPIQINSWKGFPLNNL
jgi:hypothetical protein